MKILKLKTFIISVIGCSLILLIYFLINYLGLEFNSVNFILKGISIVFIFISLIILMKLKNKCLIIGGIFIIVSRLFDTLRELTFISIFNEVIFSIFIEVLFAFGFIFVIYGFLNSVREQKKLLDELEYMALNDTLTRLPNRNFLINKIPNLIDQARNRNTLLGFLFIDLDDFKLINDTLGHDCGNILLEKTAEILKACSRKYDIVSRLSGDEFLVIVNNVKTIDEIRLTANNIKKHFNHPFIVLDRQIHITCSIGISIFPHNGNDGQTLIKNADIAMYKAKNHGKNCFDFYDDKLREIAFKKLEIIEDIRNALSKNQFFLHFQPKINIETGQLTGLEALVRWNHPIKGIIYPDEFIPIAEETGLIRNIDSEVLKLSCIQIKKWINSGVEPIHISVNISPVVYEDDDFIERIDQIIKKNEIDSSYISIEITENVLIKDISYTNVLLGKLKERNIKIVLDDFGIGYSSLSYLKDLPIDVLKIDKSFINGISKNYKDEALINAIITMAKALNISIVSEGVETVEQLQFLSKIGCNEYQGYLYSKPVPINVVDKLFVKKKILS